MVWVDYLPSLPGLLVRPRWQQWRLLLQEMLILLRQSFKQLPPDLPNGSERWPRWPRCGSPVGNVTKQVG